MTRVMPHVAFFLSYAGLGILATTALGEIGSNELTGLLAWAVPVVVAPLALLTARAVGTITIVGVAVAALSLAVCLFVATVGILVAIAVPVIGPATPGHVTRAFGGYLALGGWRLLFSLCLFVAAPVAWSALLFGGHRADPDTAA